MNNACNFPTCRASGRARRAAWWLLAIFLATGTRASRAAADIDVVEVTVTYQASDVFLPWQTKRTGIRAGYAVRLEGTRFVTTESLVRNHRLVEVRAPRSGEKVAARVVISDPQVNLALLEVSSTNWGGGNASLIDGDAAVGSDVTIVQFDETRQIQRGGGSVLRATVAQLPSAPFHSLTLTLLTDLSVTGEGAAVVCDSRLVGLVMSYDGERRQASIVPASMIARFVSDAQAPPYRGFAAAGFIWTDLIDPAKREYLGVDRPGDGILVAHCLPGTGAEAALRVNDVILEWDGKRIDNLGYYEDEEFGRLLFPHLIKGRRTPGERVPVLIARDGGTMNVEVALARSCDRSQLIPENVVGDQAEYLVEGGLVIRELTGRYLRAHGRGWERVVDARLAHLYLTQRFSPERVGDHVVILSSVLSDPANIGYQGFRNVVIQTVNGEDVRNLGDVFRIADRDGYISRVGLQGVGVDLVFDADALGLANARLAGLYRLPRLRYRLPAADADTE